MPARRPKRPTDAELVILRVLWTHGPCIVRQVNRILNETRPTGYTTTLKQMQVMTGKGLTPMATVTLRVRPPASSGKHKGKGKEEGLKTDASAGDGPVSAIFTAIDRITGVKGTLLDYRIEAVTGGREAMGEVHITVRFGGTDVPGHGASPDVLEASALAYLQAVNRFVARGGSVPGAKRPAKRAPKRATKRGATRSAKRTRRKRSR